MITKANNDVANRKHTYLFYGNVNYTWQAKACDSVRFSSATRINHVIWAWLSFQLSWIMLYCASFESYIRQNFGFFLLSGLLVGRGKKSQISRDFQGQIRRKNVQFCRNFAGIFETSFAEKWLVKNSWFRESFQNKFRWKAIGFAMIWGKFSMKLDALIAFTQAP